MRVGLRGGIQVGLRWDEGGLARWNIGGIDVEQRWDQGEIRVALRGGTQVG